MTSTKTYEQFGRQFSLAEIRSATGDFNDAHLIGRGGFGSVYKGLLDGRVAVAIKRLAAKSNQGEREFLTEIETLTKLRHRNLVSLIGYCSEQGEMLLLYDYMANGTLADYRSSLTWEQRLYICIGAARGLDYLHNGSSIVHRDVKSTNILLDEDFVARVSDFGLAKQLGPGASSHVSASVKGSFGYFDPSYFTTGRLTRKSDVYAFGVVLLEVLSGRAAVDHSLAEDELCLTMWAHEKISKGKAEQIVASNLRSEISQDCLKTFIQLVERCLHHNPMKRPTMTQTVVQLELALEHQGRTEPASSQFWLLNAIFSIVKQSGKK
ncbi:receptor-like protein kinase ANXUR1 [Salvia miltiorrhiza]|uniref:receptor-like protein kinase ANXUR1 n=1 Tax=Salvia miltiorrhiza TaxID=226208 RepID=UPI0025AD2C1F|nr:receptor-like protein kinase ANXUR1 [Salvia miltiorrhiza]